MAGESDIWSAVISAGANLAGGYLSGEGSRKAGDAQAGAAAATAQLAKDVYFDQRGLARPGYLTGGAATNKLAALSGIGPQNYEAAYGGGYSGAPSGSGSLPNLGAGQPVVGHSGGGGSNKLAAGAGGLGGRVIGNMILPGIGGEIGSALGGALGGLVRNGGDNWKTVATQAPGGFDYATYLQQPDLAAEWAKPNIKALFGNNPDAYANWHYNQFGKSEGRTLNPTAGNTQTPQPTGGTQMAGQSGGASQAMDPMAEFMASPYNKLATEATELDFGKIKGQLGSAGKSISGAGEARYAKTLAGNRLGAFDGYTNNLRSLAGMQQTASSQIGSAAGQYGANAGNAIMAGGQAKANQLAGRYQAIGQGVAGAAGAVNDYGVKNWGW